MTTLLQAVISRRTWQLVACLQVVSIASYVCHQVAVLSYLPGLSVVGGAEDEHERYRVNSMANVAALGSQMGTLGVVMALAHGLGLGDVNTAALSQFAVGVVLFAVYAAIW